MELERQLRYLYPLHGEVESALRGGRFIMGGRYGRGIAESEKTSIFTHMSSLIDNYARQSESRNEMLVPSPDTLRAVFEEGKSVVLVDREKTPVAHAALWELYTNSQRDCAVYEFGSWIVHPDFRHHKIDGLTLGELVATILLQHVDQQNTGVIATVKRLNSLNGLKKLGALPMRFHDMPFISALTCVCPATSEYHTRSCICPHRRGPSFGEIAVSSSSGVIFSIDEGFTLNHESSSKQNPAKIPCTLVGFNTGTLRHIEQEFSHRYMAIFGEPLSFDHSGLISHEIMGKLYSFYTGLGVKL